MAIKLRRIFCAGRGFEEQRQLPLGHPGPDGCEHIQQDTATCNAVIGACVRSGQWQMALGLLVEIDVNAMIGACEEEWPVAVCFGPPGRYG